jgi:hypothetical protein
MSLIASTNRFTELVIRVYIALSTIKMIGPEDPRIGELGERGEILLEYLSRRVKR